MATDPLTQKLQKLVKKNGNFCLKCQCATRPVRDGVFRCPRCGEEYLSDFGKVRKYLEETGPATARQISLATGVPTESVTMLLEGNQLEMSEDSQVFLACEICGAPIKSGKICFACSTGIDPNTANEKQRDLLKHVGDSPVSVKGTGKKFYIQSRKTGMVVAPQRKPDEESRLVVDLKNKSGS